jgi:anthranilate phosphoribosyltransferase
VLLNAGAAILVAGKAQSLQDGVATAAAAIDGGKARAALTKLAEVSNRPG